MKIPSSPLVALAFLSLVLASASSVYDDPADIKQHDVPNRDLSLQSPTTPTPSASTSRFLRAIEPTETLLLARKANYTQTMADVTHVPKQTPATIYASSVLRYDTQPSPYCLDVDDHLHADGFERALGQAAPAPTIIGKKTPATAPTPSPLDYARRQLLRCSGVDDHLHADGLERALGQATPAPTVWGKKTDATWTPAPTFVRIKASPTPTPTVAGKKMTPKASDKATTPFKTEKPAGSTSTSGQATQSHESTADGKASPTKAGECD